MIGHRNGKMWLVIKGGLGTVKKKRQDPDQILGEGMNMSRRNMDCHKKIFLHTPLVIGEGKLRTGKKWEDSINGRGWSAPDSERLHSRMNECLLSMLQG